MAARTITLDAVRKSVTNAVAGTKVPTKSALTAAWLGLDKIGAELAHARGGLAHTACKVMGLKQAEAAALFVNVKTGEPITKEQVGNMSVGYGRWIEAGFSTVEAIDGAYMLVTATWGQKGRWNTDEGKALMSDLQGCKDDAARVAMITARDLPVKADKSDTAGAGAGETGEATGEGAPPVGSDVVAVLTLALDVLGKVTLTDDERKVAAALVAQISAGLAAPVAVKA